MLVLRKILKSAWQFIQKLPGNVLVIAIIAISVVAIFRIYQCSNWTLIPKTIIGPATITVNGGQIDNELKPITCSITDGVYIDRTIRWEKGWFHKEIEIQIKGETIYDYYTNLYTFNMAYKNHAIYVEMEPLKLREPPSYRNLEFKYNKDWFVLSEIAQKYCNDFVKSGGELDQTIIAKGIEKIRQAETYSKKPIEKYIREVILPLLIFGEPIDISSVPIVVSFNFKPTGKNIELKGVGDVNLTPAIKDATKDAAHN